MSAHGRRLRRRNPAPPDLLPHRLERYARALELRAEWLRHALCVAPADRGAAEEAVGGLYRLLDRPPPRFVWVDSPAAAARLVPPSTGVLSFGGPWPLQSRLASLVSALRDRLDARIGTGSSSWVRPSVAADPVGALRSGTSLTSVVAAGVTGVLRHVVRESIAGPVRAELAGRSGLVWYGQHDVDWIAHYDVHHRVLGARFTPGDLTQLGLWATLGRSCGWWWPREGVCVLAERPAALRTEPVPGTALGEVRLHDGSGPAVEYRDGWVVWSWHGTRVPAWVIEDPTPERIAAEHNVEVRRCAIEHLGWPAFVDQAGLALVGTAADPGNPGCELRLYDLPREPHAAPARLLLAVNGSVERDGTRRRYGLRVPAWFDDPVDAAAWTYGLTGPQYARLARRT